MTYGDPFNCCGGNDEHPPYHCSDCEEHPCVGEPDPRCVSHPSTCPHATNRHMAGTQLRIAFDIGGVLSKRPDIFRPLVATLRRGGAEVFVITDMHDHEQSVRFVRGNGYDIPADNILNSDYTEHGETCKAETVRAHNIHVLVDDFPGYSAAVASETDAVSLFTWPDPHRPYYADDFKTDGTEGTFGRRKPKMSPAD